MTTPKNIAPQLIGHQPYTRKNKRPKKVYKRPSEVVKKTVGNPEGGKWMFDILYLLFILYLLSNLFK